MTDSVVTEVSPLRRATSALAGKAPAPAAKATVSVATLGGVVALVLLVAIGVAIGQTVLIPPLAASAALVFAAPALPLAQPRSVIGGQFTSAVVGFLTLAAGGASAWSAAVAGGLAIGAMALVRAPHSPAAATAVIVVLTQPDPLLFLPLLVLATGVLVAVGILAGRSGRTARYPTYWW
ncbi:HPP family protein [Streptomyces zingiberis]|uniref:HPP family protein n=1 Tax=Streptomyces zingiberis TaxID=2053010 RepID=A0ABX1BV91_9ACTN|nr:HPP family protein [Streptomyces zingiberis]NJQ01622.1 HPP family protein [Streptomyces zingiberis]